MENAKVNTSEQVIPKIYAYTTPGVTYHDGWIKIGYTERNVDERIREQTQTAHIRYKKEWDDVAIFSDGITRFSDREFHAYLTKNDVERMDPEPDSEGCPEWFKITPDESLDHFNKFRRNKGILETMGVIPYNLRKEQNDAVKVTKAYFEDPSELHEFLWNAKPRFGKTLSCYDLCKKINAQNILIVTNRPAIANSWYDDYIKFMGTESGFYFVSNVAELKNEKYVNSREKYLQLSVEDTNFKGCIEFVSLQDLKGSKYFGGSYDKLKEVAVLEWDLLVVDEAHEGVDTYKTDVAFDQIKRKYTLHLSGTPFKALANEKFSQKAIYNWTYAQEQEAKRNWDSTKEEENPYENLPQLNLFTYKMSDIVLDKVKQGKDFDNDGENEAYCFDLNEFFSTNANGVFVHDDAVDRFLDALTTQEKFPFSSPELRNELKHTLWVLHRVSSAKALVKKLQDSQKHPVFKDYKIVLAAGDGKFDEEGNTTDANALNEKVKSSYEKVRKAIDENDKTITISVGQLTTGITVPEWTAVMMLSNMKSPALYMQAAFRAQNPCMFHVGTNCLRKKNAYVFDFDPARTLSIFEQFANGLHENTANGKGDVETRKQHIMELINFFPVYGEDPDGKMIELDAEKVLSIPVRIHAKEVVEHGFMNNFLFQNIGNIFNAPQEILDIIDKVKPEDHISVNTGTKDELSLDPDGNVEIPEEQIDKKVNSIFGPGIYQEADVVCEEINDAIENTSKKRPKDGINKIGEICGIFEDTTTKSLIDDTESNFSEKIDSSARKKFERETKNEIKKKAEEIERKQTGIILDLEKEYSDKIQEAEQTGDAELSKELQKEFSDKKDEIYKETQSECVQAVNDLLDQAKHNIVEANETTKNEKNKNDKMDEIRAHLRGFSRTIPSFIMAYGDENTTLETFENGIPDEVFKEVTSITIDEFKILRDGFDKVGEDGTITHYNGFFDEVVFNDSIRYFLEKKKALANYFDEAATEDIFDYIPPQKTNQIFTPKKVVIEMVEDLEKENPGCFDDPDKTFIDLYMKSGLYITEIVKRLYKSNVLKSIYPKEEERLNHIFEKQVYGLAPTEIIYRIALAYILGFSDTIKISKNNFRQLDALPYAKEGTLEAKLDEVFGDSN